MSPLNDDEPTPTMQPGDRWVRFRTRTPTVEERAQSLARMEARHAADPRFRHSQTKEESLGVVAAHSDQSLPFRQEATAFVTFGQFSVDGVDPQEFAGAPVTQWLDSFHGITSTGVLVRTGVATGPVNIVVEATRDRPPADDTGWDTVFEASVLTESGHIYVNGFDDLDDPRNAAVTGPGSYRVRVSARGREDAYDLVVSEPIEDYLVQIWPDVSASPFVANPADPEA